MRSRRGRLVAAALAVVALGLACRTPVAPRFAELYLGDVLWGALFFLLMAACGPNARRGMVGLAAAAATELIELSQLYRAPWAESLRQTRLGGLLLGRGFSWSDVLCVALGAALAALLDSTTALRSARG
ncbi:MAG: DUF2809 domain-containing protein [Myxococcales bacterium]|nr:MAG: DUF2809 domain-containing protein [Myxococcales bacterium]